MLSGSIVPVAALTARQIAEMYQLMTRYYLNVTSEAFLIDLHEKESVAMIRDESEPGHPIRGFSTVLIDHLDLPSGTTCRVFFSGDTIVDRRFRTANPLARLVLQEAWSTAAADNIPLFWFLISKGHRTYRYLPLFFQHFHPRVDAATPTLEAELIRSFGRRRYPESFDIDRGVIRAGSGGCRLIADEAPITERRRENPHIAFFDAANPGHTRGDELCCVAEIAEANLTPAGHRILDRVAS